MKRSNRSLFVVLGVVMFVATLAGIQGFRMLERSQSHIRAALADASSRGGSLDVEGCVDHTMAWYAACEAMKSLCDATVGRMVNECLLAGDRKAACAAYGTSTRDTHFGFKECKGRGVDRYNKKACAESYRAIDRHCAKVSEQVSR